MKRVRKCQLLQFIEFHELDDIKVQIKIDYLFYNTHIN